jgi:hypothetical protein
MRQEKITNPSVTAKIARTNGRAGTPTRDLSFAATSLTPTQRSNEHPQTYNVCKYERMTVRIKFYLLTFDKSLILIYYLPFPCAVVSIQGDFTVLPV